MEEPKFCLGKIARLPLQGRGEGGKGKGITLDTRQRLDIEEYVPASSSAQGNLNDFSRLLAPSPSLDLSKGDKKSRDYEHRRSSILGW